MILSAAIILRVLVLASGAVSFHSDEAIVGLMARHINAGLPIPTFFYGQVYMGSLDPLLISVMFRVLGDSVQTIHITESLLYLLIIVTTVLLARRLSGRRWIAIAAGLLVALPPVVLTLYTTMTLGGYGETLLFGNLILLIGYDVTGERENSLWRWALLGLITGVGWWTDGLIVVYAFPVVLFGLRRASLRHWYRYGVAALLFVIGGAPWWIYNLTHQWEALHWLIGGLQSDSGVSFSIGDRALGLLFVGLPAAIGIRYSWTAQYWAGLLSALVITVYLIALAYGIRMALSRRKRGARQADRIETTQTQHSIRFVMLALGSFALIFVVSAFGSDATGRYMTPLIPTLSILLAMFGYALQRVSRVLAYGVIGGLLIFGLVGSFAAMSTIPPGITSQFDPINDFRNDSDQAVIDFLLAHHGTRGYGTYWVEFRLAYLSHEQVILDAWLPNKASLLYTPLDRRYPPYTQAVAAADRPVYVTANVPALDAIIAARFEQASITYQKQRIGSYMVFYDLSQKVTPDALGLDGLGH